MTTLKQLQALVDAGDKATQESVNLTTYSNYHGYSISTEYGDCVAERWENDPSEERLKKLMSFGDFTVIAANSRADIKALIAAYREMREFVEYLDRLKMPLSFNDSIPYLTLWGIKRKAKQILGACETTERSEDNDE